METESVIAIFQAIRSCREAIIAGLSVKSTLLIRRACLPWA